MPQHIVSKLQEVILCVLGRSGCFCRCELFKLSHGTENPSQKTELQYCAKTMLLRTDKQNEIKNTV